MTSLLICVIVGVLSGAAAYATFKQCFLNDIQELDYLKTKLEEDVAHLHMRIDDL